MSRVTNFFALMLVMLPCSLFAAGDGNPLVGFWQHESEPVVIEFLLENDLAQGLVASHTKKPEVVGESLFRDIRYDDSNKLWTGRIYVLQLGSEKDVNITLTSDDQFVMTVKIGFFTKTVIWNKVSTPVISSVNS